MQSVPRALLCNLYQKLQNPSRARSDNAFSENSNLYITMQQLDNRSVSSLEQFAYLGFKWRSWNVLCFLVIVFSSPENTKHVQTKRIEKRQQTSKKKPHKVSFIALHFFCYLYTILQTSTIIQAHNYKLYVHTINQHSKQY